MQLETKHLKHLFIIFLMILSFSIIDISIRIFANNNVGFYDFYNLCPMFLTYSWIFLFILILYSLPKKVKIISYIVLLVVFNLITFSEHIHFLTLDRFYGFSDLLMASNATGYISSLLNQTVWYILFSNILSLFMGIGAVILIKYTENIKTRYINILFIVLIVLFRIVGMDDLGVRSLEPDWQQNDNVRSVYDSFANYNKSLEVSGLYEYIFRSTYLYIYNNLNVNKGEMSKELDEYFSYNESILENNEYTGIFKDKNVIYILMESIDNWLVTEEVMPTLYKLQNEGINFINKYSPTFGSGQTINSEFAMHTSLYAINGGKAIYNFSDNKFPHSLANSFKNNGYKTTSIHANDGDFYNRRHLHASLGFDSYYFLKDMDEIDKNVNYFKDSNLMNDEIFNLMISDEKFLTFLITYSAHLPYNFSNDKCAGDPYNLETSSKSLTCIRNLARDTDEMIRLLIEKLEEKNILDDTVLVFVTDHYTYGYDEEYVKMIKNTDNEYLLQNTPFVIWSNDIEGKTVDLMVDTADILPTLLNMFGIEYNPNYYIGEDIFSKDRDNFVYFAADIFYDGNIFYDENSNLENDYANEILLKIKNKIELNDRLIISDYFK